MPSNNLSLTVTQIQTIIQASTMYTSTGGVDADIWRSGSDRGFLDRLGAHCIESSNETLGSSRSTMLLQDFASKKVIWAFIRQLAYWLSLGRRVGIVIPAALVSNHSHIFHRAIAYAFIRSMCDSPYSIAYRVFDMATGAQSITEVEQTATGELVYKSSIQGPVDRFPLALLRAIPSVRVIQLTPPMNPSAFFSAQSKKYHTDVINDLSYHMLSDHTTLRDFCELWISPKVLFFKHNITQLCLMDILAVWADDVKIRRLVLTGLVDDLQIDQNTGNIQKAFPYLEGGVETYSTISA